MKLFRTACAALAAMTLSMGAATSAGAVDFPFTVNTTGGNIGPSPYGNVNVTVVGNALQFVVTLYNGLVFHSSNSNHDSFAFNLAGNPSVTMSNITTGFSRVGANPDAAGAETFGQSGTGNFGYALCSLACSGNSALAGPLSFLVTPTAGSLTLASLVANSSGYLFSADISGGVGTVITGNIGVPVGGVPEPATWAMMIIGLGMVGAGLRLRRRDEAVTA